MKRSWVHLQGKPAKVDEHMIDEEINKGPRAQNRHAVTLRTPLATQTVPETMGHLGLFSFLEF